MPIINKGKLTLSEVVQRQVNQDWPAANTDYDLFVQDLIASGNVVANGLIIRNIEVSDNILTGNVTASSITANTLTLDIITANTFVGIDTDQVPEGSNLYFTNTRAILSVFPATTQLVVSTPVFNYNIDQYSGDNPEIYVTAGETISFELLHSSSHPFNIRVSDGGSEYNNGLIHVDTDGTISTGSAAQGKYTGKLFWKIPYELAGNTYVYQCTNHSSMVGNIVIQGSVLSTITNRDVTLNNLTVNGDLVVQGNTTTLNTATLVVEDKNIVLANGAADAATADGAGITIDGAGANITYSDSGDKFVINKNTDIEGNITFINGVGSSLVLDSITANTWSGLIAGDYIDIEANGRISANISLVSNAQTAQSVQSLSNFTTDDLTEGNNLYYTNARSRAAFTAGYGIIIQENGVISRTADTDLYNLDLDGSVGYVVTDSMQELIGFPTTPTDSRYLLRSLHVTNVSEQDTFVSANVLYASGNVAHLASRIPVPEGGVLEFLKKTQVFSPGDKIHIQGYDSTGTPASGVLNAIVTYQTISEDFAYVGQGSEVIQNNANVQVYLSGQSYTIFESIKLVNLEDYSIKTKVLWADANDLVKSYLTYNIPVPPNSSIEILQNPKRIEKNDKILLSHQTDGNVSIFLSGRLGEVFVIESFTPLAETGGNIDISFQTTEAEETLLYYSIDE